MDSNDRGGSGVGFGIGLVAGALFGAAVGLLLAPKSGAELRGDLNARAREAGDRLKEQVRQAEDAAAAWAERGREVYESVGCLACHGAPDPRENGDWTPPVPFGAIGGKWNPAALAAFLREPHLSRPGGGMPSLLLSEEESDALATFLVRAWGPGSGSQAEGDDATIARGRAAFVARGCASCHELDGVEASDAPAALAGLLDALAAG